MSLDINLKGDAITPVAYERAAFISTLAPYKQSSEIIEMFFGYRMSASWIDDLSDVAGKAAHCDQLELIQPPEKQLSGSFDIIQVDGSQIPMHSSWEEVKTAVVGELRVGGCDGSHEIAERWYHTCKSGRRVFERELARLCKLRNIRSDRVIVMGDGALWIWGMYERLFPNAVQILDFYHACEHIQTAMEAIWGKESSMVPEEAARLRNLLKTQKNGCEQVIAYFKEHLKNPSIPETDRKVLRRELAYFSQNQDRMHYSEYRARGMPIGTGLVESTQKWLIQSRLKRPGMHWSRTGSRRKLALKTLLANQVFKHWFRQRFGHFGVAPN